MSVASVPGWRSASWVGRPSLVGVGFGLLVSSSPLTPSLLGDHFGTSLAIGALAGLGAAAWEAARTPAPRVVWPLIAAGLTPVHWLVLGVLVLGFLPTFVWLLQHWTFSLWRDVHGLFVPIAMAMLARRTLARAAPFETDGSPLAALALAPAVLLLCASFARGEPMLGAVALVVAVPGAGLWVLGADLARSLWPVFVLGVFMLPAPLDSPLHAILMEWTAITVHPVVTGAGLSVLRDGTTLDVGAYAFEVARSCSGVSTLYAMGFVGLTLSSLCRSRRRRAAVALLALPVAFVANALRVSSLIVASLHAGTDFLDTPIHRATGAVTFLLAFAVLAVTAGMGPLRVIAGLPERDSS